MPAIHPASFPPSLAEQRAYWDERWSRSQRPNAWQQRRGEELLALIDQLGLRAPRILDLGCATGWFVAELAKRGSAIGIDLSPEAIAIARAHYPELEFHAGDLYTAQLGREAFDVIVCQEVIAHVADQPQLVAQIAAALRPGGYLLITTADRFVMDRTDHPPDPTAHIKQWLSRRAFLALLRPAFKVLRTFTIIPMGEHGVLRLVNSYKLNRVLRPVFGAARLERLKERMGCGYTRIVLARKPAMR